MENVLCIDIGTGFAKAAIIYPGLKEPILLIPHDMPMGMSSVAYVTSDGEIKMKGSPVNCTPVRNIKTRLSEESISVPVGSKTYDIEPGKVYGEIAKALIITANQMLGELGRNPVYKVVVTYPAAFIHSEDPRLTTRCVETIRQSVEALTIDGNKIEVIKMLPEPVAAAYESICYERNVKENPIKDKSYNIAVFDLGHGTFDIAVVTSTDRNDQPFDVVAQGGDKEIGGRIFDDKIFNRICKNLGHPDKIRLTPADEEELHYIKSVDIKHGLTDSDNYYDNFFPKNVGEFVEIGMTKSEFESLIQTDLNSALIKTAEVIDRAKKKNVTINEIVLTGGSSKIKAIEQMLNKAFAGENIKVRSFRPEHAVVFGGARYAFDLEKEPVKQHAEYSYGIFMEENSRVKFLIDSDDEVPKKSRVFNLTPDSCSETIRVCRSKSTLCTAKDLSYSLCNEIWRFRFDTVTGQPHSFFVNLDDTHKVTVECEYPDGKKITKTKYDD